MKLIANTPFNKRFAILNIALITGLYSLSAQSAIEPVSNAGSLQQSIDQERNQNPLPPKVAPEPVKGPAQVTPTGVTVMLNGVVFKGNKLLSTEKLNKVVAPFIGKQLDFSQLQGLAYVIEAAYKEENLMVFVRLPEQKMVGGILTIEVTEAYFGQTLIEGETTRINPDKVKRVMDAQIKRGYPLNTADIDRGLLLSDDLPGVTVSGSLLKDPDQSTTDVIAKVSDDPFAYGNALIDNTGAVSTGSNRFFGNVALNSPAGIGDLLSSSYLHTQGSNYGRLAYAVPVANDGMQAGVSISTLSYNIISGAFASSNAFGGSQTAGLDANYPIIRSRTKNLYVGVNSDYRTFNNSALGQSLSKYNVMDNSISLYGNSFDDFGGGGANTVNIVYIKGYVDLTGSANQWATNQTTHADGGFNKIRYSFSRNQAVIDGVSVYGSLSGQETTYNLDSSEKFYLGGAYGVRAYPTSEGAGSKGRLVTAEVRKTLPQNLTGTVFYDYGQVIVNANNNILGRTALNQYALQGGGLALSWQPLNYFNVRGTWARRVGSNPNPTLLGFDQDGTKTLDRFWLGATIVF
jgi:hemolysin activation/secretion protein